MGKKDKSLKAAQPQVTKGVVSKAVPVSAKSSKSKKAAPPPPPSSSSSSEDDSSESEAEVPKAATNGKTVQNTNISAGPDSDSDSESDSDSDSVSSSDASSHQEKPKTAKAATVNAVSSTAKSDSDSSDSDDSGSDSDSEKAVPAPKQVPTKKDDESSSSDSDADSDDTPATKVVQKVNKELSDSEDSDDDDSDISMKDGTVPATTGKRKAEVEAVEPAKKAKIGEDASLNAPSSTIWIGNLSWNVDDDWLKTEFETYGELVSARVQMDRNSGRSRGFGYVEFKEMSAAQAAVDDHTKEIDGRAPRVDFAPPRSAPDPTKRAKAFDDKVSEPSSILFVGNLSFDATEDGCWEAFGDFGEVLSVRLPTDRETQQPKGFGYVEFGDQASAIKAFEALRGKELFGRAIRLDYSHPRDPSSGSRGGRGGDRGRGGFRGGDRGGRGGPRGGFRGGRGGDRGRGAARGRGAGARAFEGKKITF